MEIAMTFVGLLFLCVGAASLIRLESRDASAGKWEDGPLLVLGLLGLSSLLALMTVFTTLFG
jgi:hypothetical protein